MEKSATSSPDYSAIKGKEALIDGDILVYRCAFVAERTHYAVYDTSAPLDLMEFDNHKDAKAFVKDTGLHIWSRKEVQPVEFALEALKTTLSSILEKIETDKYKVFLSGKRNFRDDIAVTQPYKGNRDSTAKPIYWRDCRDYLARNWGAIVSDGIEADDCLGINLTRAGDSGVIVSNDKDLDQVPGWHFDWTQDHVYKVTPKQASFALYSQILSGDATDNVPGLAGIGPTKSNAILQGSKSEKELFARTWDAYRTRGPGKSDDANWNYLIEQARLVYILRSVDDAYKPLEI